jgi:uncharacterized protein (DUF1697 family)
MTPAKASTRYVALLRGINVGGNNMLPMKELVDIVEQAGCATVSTCIQSGNVLFMAKPDSEQKLAIGISQGIEARFGYKIPVVVRTREEIRPIAAAHPFLSPGINQKSLFVYFLRDAPSPEAVNMLDPNRSVPDIFVVKGREIYVNLLNNMAKTKLSNAWFDSKLKTISTARNWNTVLKLHELLNG